ncbi:DUF302 domain-containing protein [Kribbella sp. NPDC003505]|uniref:DUF302 domain-containing protein n=1 Tax=Kribbella sp. NPDC003505 TaxID=3154448 RepID=UPI0033A40C5F
MSGYTLMGKVGLPYQKAVEAVRSALAEQGFGILSEIDLKATLSAKLGVDVPEQVILGACRPPLAYRALQADPSIAVMLPCNVVVRALDETTSAVEAFNPDVMLGLSAAPELGLVARDAKDRLVAVLATVSEEKS